MEAPKSTGEAAATTVAPVAEDVPTTTITPDAGAATVTEKPVSEATINMPDAAAAEATATTAELSIIERVSVTVDALTGLMAIIDIFAAALVLCCFIYLGAFRKIRNEEGRNFVTFLFSSWASFRREIAIRNQGSDFGSLITTFMVNLEEGSYSSKSNPKAGEGQILLLPKKRRAVVNEIKTFTDICVKGLEAEIGIQGTAARFCFCAGSEEFNRAQEKWKRLGELIEEEEAALFINDHYLDEVYLIEIVFSDEGRKAKSMAVSYNPKEAEEAKTWFWWKVAPLFVLSLFIVHWALLGMILAVARFVHNNGVKPEKQDKNMSRPENLNQLINDYQKLRRKQGASK